MCVVESDCSKHLQKRALFHLRQDQIGKIQNILYGYFWIQKNLEKK